MATGCESQRWETLADPRPGRGPGDEWIDCVGSISASPRPVDELSFTAEDCASDPSVWTPNVLRLLVGDVA